MNFLVNVLIEGGVGGRGKKRQGLEDRLTMESKREKSGSASAGPAAALPLQKVKGLMKTNERCAS